MAAVVDNNNNNSSGPPSPNQVGDEDEVYDEDDDRDPHAALVDHVRSDNRNNREALAYLLRYETMVRQQEAEDMATMAHLRPCLERLKELLPKDITQDSKEDSSPELMNKQQTEEAVWTRQISYSSLRKALEILELQGPTEFMTTDRQLMMILRLVTQSTGKDMHRGPEATLTWAELVQCYKTCIVGMTTLQHLPKVDETRQRARDRTLAMLALFEPTGRLWSSPVAHPTRSLANTSALSSTQRSSFAPPRAVQPRKDKKNWLVVGTLLLCLGLGSYYYYHYYDLQQEMLQPRAALSKPQRSVERSSTPRQSPTFSARNFVPTTTSAAFKPKLAPAVVNDFLEEDEDEFGVYGPALLVTAIGTPAAAILTQTVLQQMGSGAAVIGVTAVLSTFGKALVTFAGVLSLTSLFLRSVRALFQGLGRLGEERND